ncbi:MAG TPA: hypothetical protein PLU50_06395, partial [Pseudobdellovibrionaceae bacterium]|nr:hypothetical protein [Pseudobdellovibrionaceae bacterium]
LEWTQFKNITSNQMVTGTPKDPVTHPVTHPVTFSPSKLDSNLKINTNLLGDRIEEYDELSQIDFSSISGFGITSSIVADIRKNKWDISRSQLETHIERFYLWASDDQNRKGIVKLRGLFCANIKQISIDGSDPLDWVKTESDLALESLLEQKRQHLLIKRQQQEELRNIEFETWMLETPVANMKELVKESQIAKFGSDRYRELARDYFNTMIWQGPK